MDIEIGDSVCWNCTYGNEIHGIVKKIDDKIASIETKNGIRMVLICDLRKE